VTSAVIWKQHPARVFRGNQLRYLRDIDGLRALAVLPVLLFHANIPGFSGGFVGVDVFFVISGFLITRIILDELECNKFSIVNFYERRFRRIFPAAFVVLLATSFVCLFLFLPKNLIDFAKSLTSSSLFYSNFYFWKYSGYFESSALLRPLLHTWSLSLEEQFYIFTPIMLLIVFKLFRNKLVYVLMIFFVASLCMSIFMTERGPTANFFLLPTRAWELLFGSIICAFRTPLHISQNVLRLLSYFGILLILTAVLTYSEMMPFPGVTALLPCSGAAFVILASVWSASGTVNGVLSSPLMVWIGKISYPLYLAHWPVIVFFRYTVMRGPNLHEAIFLVLLAFVFAVLIYRYVETPVRTHQILRMRTSLLMSAFCALGVLAISGVVIVAAGGFPHRFPDFKPWTAERGLWREGVCFYENSSAFTQWKSSDCKLTSANNGQKALLWGDSYAAHYSTGIVKNQSSIPFDVFQYTFAGCPPVLNYRSYARPDCFDFNQNVLRVIKENGITTVVMSGRWVDLQSRGLDGLEDTVKALTRAGVTVYVIGQSPVFPADVNIINFNLGRAGQTSDSWYSVVQPEINKRLKAYSGTAFIDPTPYLCDVDAKCAYKHQSSPYYSDDGHFTVAGSNRAVAAYFPLLRK
jgi:peptidoglycan/LPS O-acetylase OafA/YrhL